MQPGLQHPLASQAPLVVGTCSITPSASPLHPETLPGAGPVPSTAPGSLGPLPAPLGVVGCSGTARATLKNRCCAPELLGVSDASQPQFLCPPMSHSPREPESIPSPGLGRVTSWGQRQDPSGLGNLLPALCVSSSVSAGGGFLKSNCKVHRESVRIENVSRGAACSSGRAPCSSEQPAPSSSLSESRRSTRGPVGLCCVRADAVPAAHELCCCSALQKHAAEELLARAKRCSERRANFCAICARSVLFSPGGFRVNRSEKLETANWGFCKAVGEWRSL